MSKLKHAVVIGGSLAGLLAARVLSGHCERVTIIERDPIRDEPEARKGQPHVRALHGLLASGGEILQELFPCLLDDLRQAGALVNDMGETMHWYVAGGYRRRMRFGKLSIGVSRPFLEWLIRGYVLGLPNLTLCDGRGVAALVASSDQRRVVGVQLAGNAQPGAETLRADLVVDASGRGTSATRWLRELGYAPPPESVVNVDVGYAHRLYARDPEDPRTRSWIFVTPVAPAERRVAGAFPVEGNRWLVGMGGWFGDHPPTDEAGFRAFARSLPAPDVAEIVEQCAPLSPIGSYKYAASTRRHYERLSRFPEGYLVLGDAICSFNPVYGQGMTSAAMQARVLGRLLAERQGTIDGIARPYFRQVAKIVDIPWQLAVGEDFRFPEAIGRRPPGTHAINSYVSMVHRASHHDPLVSKAFLEVMNLLKPPSSLMAPQIMWRVFARGQERSRV